MVVADGHAVIFRVAYGLPQKMYIFRCAGNIRASTQFFFITAIAAAESLLLDHISLRKSLVICMEEGFKKENPPSPMSLDKTRREGLKPIRVR